MDLGPKGRSPSKCRLAASTEENRSDRCRLGSTGGTAGLPLASRDDASSAGRRAGQVRVSCAHGAGPCRSQVKRVAPPGPVRRVQGARPPARGRATGQSARAHLLYGEWLRRENRRVDARDQLRAAHQLFTAIGMEAFAERARGELLMTGERVRARTAETRDELTQQERQIARLARDGLSNPEIGARLFLSPRTVEWHLRKVFAKLDIASRKELANALPEQEFRLVSD
jgi:DNA-binding CsgD family transcriptional regulator